MNHMNTKTVIGLGTAAALAIVAAVAVTYSRKPVLEKSESIGYALPELRDRVNDVRSITIAGAGNATLVTVENSGPGWTVRQKGGYPANFGEIRALLLKLAGARLLEKKTANEGRYSDLGVEDTGKPDAKGVLVTLEGLGQPVQMIIGKSNTRGNGTFIRRPEEKQSWLIGDSLTPAKDAKSWLDTSLTDIPSSRIKEVVLRRPDGKILRVFKQAGDANFKLADIPKGREMSFDFAANSLGSLLSGLRFEDVMPAGDAAPPTDGKTYQARLTTFDGLIVEIQAWTKDEKHFARLDASLDAALADAGIQSEQAKAKAEYEAKQPKNADEQAQKAGEPAPLAVSDPAKDREQRLAALQSELGRMTPRFTNWTFTLPAYSFSSLEKSLDDFLKPLAEGKPAPKTGRKPSKVAR